jgi:hypothetical protein
MPGKKSHGKKTIKKIKNISEDENLEDHEDITKKSNKKSLKTIDEKSEDHDDIIKKSNKKSLKSIDENTDDELSDIELNEEEVPIESDDNDEIATSYSTNQILSTYVEKNRLENSFGSGKKIDPNTPIGSLKTVEIISYLIQVGTETLNPQLKSGALNLLRQLSGRRPYPLYGSKRGGFGRGFVRGRGRRGLSSRFPQNMHNIPNKSHISHDNLYES